MGYKNLVRIFASLIFLIGVCAFSCFSQKKVEREIGIKHTQVPTSAKTWMKDAYEGVKKINWFEEHADSGKSFEAKLKWKKHWHSVKFDTLGNIIDLEVETKLETLPTGVYSTISKCLDSAFIKHNIRKVQIQYTGNSEDLEDLIDENENEGITTHYEIEFFGKTELENEMWEGLFDHSGMLIQCRIIQLSPTDNLHY